MPETFEQILLRFFESSEKDLLLIKNPDGFLKRKDVQSFLLANGIHILEGKSLDYRLHFELYIKPKTHGYHTVCFLVTDIMLLLEDIEQAANRRTFQLKDYLFEYHHESLKECDFKILNILYEQKPLRPISRSETKKKIQYLENLLYGNPNEIQLKRNHLARLESFIEGPKNWDEIILTISAIINHSLEQNYFSEIKPFLVKLNKAFQLHIQRSYKASIIPSNPVKKPRIVSKILGHISYNYKPFEKVALIVIDGMAYWQYLLVDNTLKQYSLRCKHYPIYSWIPSITQLSRQAIFKGDRPFKDYRQNPKNEENLWRQYWKKKGLNNYQIGYYYDQLPQSDLSLISKLALVNKELDEKMHGSTDYRDLKSLTENWIRRSRIIPTIQRLIEQKFTVFLTTDHGNIDAIGWRKLKKSEKLGTNQSGSRSMRHLEYSQKQLAKDFLENNPDIRSFVEQEEQAIYLTNNMSFSSKASLVTHGGSHILEVLIPFVKITHE